MLAIGRSDHYRYANAASFRGCYPRLPLGDMEISHVLVVSRKPGERILIGDKIAITVVKVASGAVRLGVEAPAEMAVMREELAEEIRKAEQAAVESSEI